MGGQGLEWRVAGQNVDVKVDRIFPWHLTDLVIAGLPSDSQSDGCRSSGFSGDAGGEDHQHSPFIPTGFLRKQTFTNFEVSRRWPYRLADGPAFGSGDLQLGGDGIRLGLWGARSSLQVPVIFDVENDGQSTVGAGLRIGAWPRDQIDRKPIHGDGICGSDAVEQGGQDEGERAHGISHNEIQG